MEFIQDSLGHQDMKITMNYWGGFANPEHLMSTLKDSSNDI
jgi:hypothetical protein